MSHWQLEQFLLLFLDRGNAINRTFGTNWRGFFYPYTKWMGIGGISDYPALYMFLLPILATLPLSDLYARDRSTGFIRFNDPRQAYTILFQFIFH